MSTYIGTRDYIDLPEWRPLSQPVYSNLTSLATGSYMTEDFRNNDYSNGLVYFNSSASILSAYDGKNDAWKMITNSFGGANVVGLGACSVFVPSLGPRGKLTGTNTTTKLNLDSVWLAPASATWTRSGSIITVTTTSAHGFSTVSGQTLYISATSDATATNVVGTTAAVTVTGATTFTYTGLAAGALSGTITMGVYINANQLSNRGDSKGCIIRVIGNAAGSSGKTEERHIIANTAGVTPTVILDEPLSFTPIAGDTFEFLSGSHILLTTGTLTTNQFRRFDVATSQTVSLSTTGLLATIPSNGNNFLIATDEGYVPHTRKCYEGYYVGTAVYDTANTLTGGMKGCLQATATAAGTLTGQASGGDAGVVANQFRNYQIRIVEDASTPTAVGQRRKINSHTAGASPVYTLVSNWTVTPSATAEYVIENWTDNILFFAAGSSTMYNYTHSSLTGTGTTRDTWSTTTWTAKPNAAQAAGAMVFHSFGILPDELNSVKASNIFLFRGAVNAFDILDIAGGTTGSWTTGATAIDYGGSTYDVFSNSDTTTFSYNPHTQGGRYMYAYLNLGANVTQMNQRSAMRFDVASFKYEKYAGMRIGASVLNTLYQSKFGWISLYHDPTTNTKVAFWNCNRIFGNTEFYQTPLLR